jgi:ABC-type transporter Mla subunit MlaD
VAGTIADVKAQLGEAFKRTEEVTGALEGALTMIEEVQALVLAATDGSVHRAIEQLTSALVETRDSIQDSMSSLGSAVQEGRDYCDAL